ILCSILLIPVSNACTVWGAVTPNELLIAKNRDFYPGNQNFKVIKKKHKYSFLGLYGDNEYDNNYVIKMGINETGLTVFMTFASSVPLKQRTAKVPYYKVMENILKNYNNIDKVYNDSKELFKDSTPINYIFADRNKAMICEIGLNNEYRCIKYSRNNYKVIPFAQTNHYLHVDLAKYNFTPRVNQQSSYYRYFKIRELMESNLNSLSFEKFINFSFNTEASNDNPLAKFDLGYNNTYQENSIFRTFNSHPDRKDKLHKNSDQGVSTMIVSIPINKKPIKVYLRIINSINDLNDKNFTQKIKYSEAITTLNHAINYPNAIKYNNKVCIRDKNTKTCL
ncbi:MAG: carcinine hydrolase/isopenicillin-N N-acyltransferase family protein, partial [Neisseriaceae bacterium]